MDFTTEIVNITKIKDGFFLGDEATATNLDVIIQFKITHMINSAGSQIINAWETIGIKYLTLNWSENPSQILFDQKDEIASRIVNFIDESFKTGEGLLVHSLRGQNRGCVVVIIYMIKKYRWTLAKCLEYLTNKKSDVEIPKYFLNQLSLFESRLSKICEGPISNTWNDFNENDPDEGLIRNTYINGLIQTFEGKSAPNKSSIKRVGWSDNNNVNRKDLLCTTNFNKDLYSQKEIKPVTSHKKLIPSKSCLKSGKSNSVELIKSSSSQLLNKFTEIGNNAQSITDNNPNKVNKFTSGLSQPFSSFKNSSDLMINYSQAGNCGINNNQNIKNTKIAPPNDIVKQENIFPVKMEDVNPLKSGQLRDSISQNQRQNHFALGGNFPQQRSASAGGDSTNNRNGDINNLKNITMKDNNGEVTKIIITSKFENIVNHNINNIYIQTPEVLESMSKYNQNQNPNPALTMNASTANTSQSNSQGFNPILRRPSNTQKMNGVSSEQIPGSGNYISSISLNLMQNKVGSESGLYMGMRNESNIISSQMQHQKITKSVENQRSTMNNNYFSPNALTNSGIGVCSNTNNIPVLDKKLKVIDYNSNVINGNQNYIQQNSNTLVNSTIGKNQLISYNNYQPLMNTQNKTPVSSNNPQMKLQNFPLNNYEPALNKKNNFNVGGAGGLPNTNLFNRTNNNQTVNKGPIRIHNEYDRKPSTPDQINNCTNLSTIKFNNPTKVNTCSNLPAGGQQGHSQFGTIYRSNSKQKNEPNERPSTAPQKDKNDEKSSTFGPMKRLPSPNIKSNSGNPFWQTQKSNPGKYRAPSPAVINKSSTITLGSLKSTVNSKPKWT